MFSSQSTVSTPMSYSFPQFFLNSKDIEVLLTPNEFYRHLVDLYSQSTRRIVLAALYLGTGSLEKNIIESIVDAYSQNFFVSSPAKTKARKKKKPKKRKNDLTVDILLDATRGTRSEAAVSSPTSLVNTQPLTSLCTLIPLLELSSQVNHSPNINIHLFHSPLLSGILHKILPSRINEIIGVFHTKIFIGDDTVILTGANISSAYLTNRQDRYILIRDSPIFVNFLHKFVKHIQRFSLKVFFPLVQNFPTPSDYYCERIVRVPLSSSQSRYAFLCRKVNISSPISDPKTFRKMLGEATESFLRSYTQCSILRSFNVSSADHQATKTLLFVALQIPFTCPPLLHENMLMESLLGPLPSLMACPKRSWYKRLVAWVRRFCSPMMAFSNANKISLFSPPIAWNLTTNCCKPEEKTLRRSDSVDEDISTKSSANDTMPTTTTTTTTTTTPISNTCHSRSENPRRHPFLVSDDQAYTLRDIFSSPIQRIVIASGYLNMRDQLLQLLVNALQDTFVSTSYKSVTEPPLQLYVAAPDANSFYQSRGLSKYIPMAYSFIGAHHIKRLKQIWTTFAHLAQYHLPTLSEYSKKSWTFHSKGLWLYTADQKPFFSKDFLSMALDDTTLSLSEDDKTKHDADGGTKQQSISPSATVIGSSNYGLRSSVRDLDMSFLLITQDNNLKQKLHKEILQIKKNSYQVSDDSLLTRRCPFWLQLFLRWIPFKTLL